MGVVNFMITCLKKITIKVKPLIQVVLFVKHTHGVESGIRQPVIQDPRTSEPIDHVIEDQQNVEQPIEQQVEQQVPHE